MAHTKGPWKVANYCFYASQYADKEFCITAPKRGRIAKALKLSDAELIARAPEMSAEIEQLKEQRDELLEAAKLVLSNKRGEDAWLILAVHCRMLEEAIDKATSK